MTDSKKAVFLSYASEDSAAAERICAALRSAGIEVWFDQSELRGGDAWDRQIRSQIHDCALFVPIISTHSQARLEGYFRREWKMAADRTHDMAEEKAFLLPVVIDDTSERSASVPDRFRDVQWTRFAAGMVPSAFVERVSRLLSPHGRVSGAPEGAEARGSSGSGQTIGKPPQRSWKSRDALVLIVMLVVIAGVYFAVNHFMMSKRTAEVPSASTPSTPSIAPVANAIPEKSIAVLPFVDMSEKHDQEYFSDGLSEELIDLLTKVPDLRVPARTSSFYFKGKSEDIATIAQKLRVAHVLEGSIRKAGNRLRVTAQLIRADNGYHLWSETYDRDLKDIFKVQDEIAAAVVTALKLRLATIQPSSPRHTTNIEAYNEFLLGTQSIRRGDPEGYRLAGEAYRKAITLDPNYAEAYATLAYVEMQTEDPSGLARARATANKAVELAPDQASGYAARGLVRVFSWNWAGAQADYQKALAIDPSYGATQLGYAYLLGNLDRLPEAIAAARKAVEIDPLSGEWWALLGYYLICNRDFVGAKVALHRALEVSPNSQSALWYSVLLPVIEGKASEALMTARRLEFETARLLGIALAEHSLGNAKESQQALDGLIAKHAQDTPFAIALVYGWRVEKDKAFEWLENTYAQHNPDLSDIQIAPLLASLRSDSRFKALLRKMNLPE